MDHSNLVDWYHLQNDGPCNILSHNIDHLCRYGIGKVPK